MPINSWKCKTDFFLIFKRMKITELSTESESEIPGGQRKYEINKSSKELLINSRKEKPGKKAGANCLP